MSINVGTAVAYLDLDASKFTQGMSSAIQNLNTFVDSSSALSQKITSFGTALSGVGNTFNRSLTLPIAGIGTLATKVAGDFESAMSKVEAISGATEEQLGDLRDTAIEMGAKTKFSAKESADAFTYMAMAGWDAEQMIAGISGIMSLAAADGLDLATTSDIVTDALTAFGLQASDSAHFADVLAQASSSANTNVSMLGESFKYIAPVAGSLGMSVEDTALALGLMANSGIKGSQAGTALRASLTNLVKPTEAMEKKMTALGIEVTNSDGTMKSLREILEILRGSFSTLSEAEQANAAATIFGKEAMSAMLAIINASEQDFYKLSDAIDNASGRADAMAETMMDNLPGAIEELKGALESLMIKIGEALIPVIKEVTEFITKIVEKLNKLSDEEIQQIVKIAALVAAIGPVITIVGKVITIIGTVLSVGAKVVSGIKILASFISGVLIPAISTISAPVLVVIGVITALVAIGVALYKNWEEISAFAKECWEAIKQAVASAVEAIANFFKDLMQVFKDIAQAIGDFIGKVVDLFKSMFNAIVEWGSRIIEKAVALGRSIYEGIAGALEKVADFFQNIFSSIWEFLTGLGEKMFEAGKNLISSLLEGIKSAWDSIVSWLDSVFGPIIDKISGLFSPVFDFVGGMFSGSHANGLDYVPYDGYVAQLHEGERVLTKEENKDYGTGKSGGGDTYIFQSPKQIDEYEATRLLKQTKRELDL